MENHNLIFYPKENKSAVVKSLLANRIWEKKIDLLIKKYVKCGMVCLDVGAYIGSHAKTMLDLGAEVHLFEPQPLIVQCLLATKNNNNYKKWEIHPCALSNINGKSKFNTNNDGDARFFKVSKKLWKTNFLVKTKTLDSYNFNKIDFIKIDAEGSEFLILEGGKLTIENSQPIIIIEVFNTKKNKEKLNDFASNYNYTIESINSENYLLTPKLLKVH